LAARKSPKDKADERRREQARAERRARELASLASATSSFSSALDTITEAAAALLRSSKALDTARAAAVSPELVQYGILGRLRPLAVQRAVQSVSSDLRLKVASVRSSDLSVHDGSEEAYEKLVSRISAAADSIREAIEDFGRSLPAGAARPHPAVRNLVMASAKAAALLNRLAGRGRTSVSVHSAAVQAEIAAGDVSFY
jgi:hypothetical protein